MQGSSQYNLHYFFIIFLLLFPLNWIFVHPSDPRCVNCACESYQHSCYSLPHQWTWTFLPSSMRWPSVCLLTGTHRVSCITELLLSDTMTWPQADPLYFTVIKLKVCACAHRMGKRASLCVSVCLCVRVRDRKSRCGKVWVHKWIDRKAVSCCLSFRF